MSKQHRVLSPRRKPPRTSNPHLNTSSLSNADYDYFPSISSPLPQSQPVIESPSITFEEDPFSSANSDDDLSIDVTSQLMALENRLSDLSELSKKEKQELTQHYEAKISQLKKELESAQKEVGEQSQLIDDLSEQLEAKNHDVLAQQEQSGMIDSSAFEKEKILLLQRFEQEKVELIDGFTEELNSKNNELVGKNDEIQELKYQNLELIKQIEQDSMRSNQNFVENSGEIDRLQQEIAQKDDVIVEKEQEIARLRQNLNEMSQNFEEEITALTSQLDSLQRSIKSDDQKSSEVNRLLTLNNELQVQLDEWSSEYASLQTKYESEIERLIAERKSLLTGNQVNQSATQAINQDSGDVSLLQHQVHSLSMDVSRYSALLKREQDRNYELQSDFDMLERQRGEALERQENDYRTVIDELSCRLRDLEQSKNQEIEKVKQSLDGSVKNMIEDQKRRHELELKESVSYEKSLVAKEYESKMVKLGDEFRSKLVEKDRLLEVFEREVTDLRNFREKVESILSSLFKNTNQINDQWIFEKLDFLISNYGRLNQLNSEIQLELDELKSKNSQLLDDLSTLNRNFQQKSIELDQSQSLLESCRRDHSKLSIELESLKKEYMDELESQKFDHERSVEEISQSINQKFDGRLHRVLEEKEELNQEISRLRSEVVNLKQELHDKELEMGNHIAKLESSHRRSLLKLKMEVDQLKVSSTRAEAEKSRLLLHLSNEPVSSASPPHAPLSTFDDEAVGDEPLVEIQEEDHLQRRTLRKGSSGFSNLALSSPSVVSVNVNNSVNNSRPRRRPNPNPNPKFGLSPRVGSGRLDRNFEDSARSIDDYFKFVEDS
ncbi:hypothetical protein P9112_014403 [Eukaryota sp. TZLM1-RC]